MPAQACKIFPVGWIGRSDLVPRLLIFTHLARRDRTDPGWPDGPISDHSWECLARSGSPQFADARREHTNRCGQTRADLRPDFGLDRETENHSECRALRIKSPGVESEQDPSERVPGRFSHRKKAIIGLGLSVCEPEITNKIDP